VAAVPLLEEFGFPATLYLTTFYCQHQSPVFTTMCRYLLWRGRDTTLDTSALLNSRGRLIPLRTDSARLSVFYQLIQHVTREQMDWQAKDEVLSQLANALGIDYGALCASRMLYLLSPEEVSRLPADLIDVQLHTHRHRVPLDRGKFIREIEENRAFIADLRPGSCIRHFCYPSGVTDPRILPWLRETNVASATTGVLGLASKRSHPLLLPRLIDTSNLIDIEFSGWLDGVAALLPRRPAARTVSMSDPA
jgi:peptidoglycan/xylan/chitin deacetylase (PgdA/CDA1 family)